MHKMSRHDGFTIVELMVSMAITLVVLAGAMTAISDAMRLNDAGLQVADSNQNLRSGANLMIRDLLQAGRLIPIGGIPIPSGAGAVGINRPSPPNTFNFFDNVGQVTLTAITTGSTLGPLVNNATTDIVTILMIDPLLPFANLPAGALAADGASVTLGPASPWITGLNPGPPVETVNTIKQGDLVWFNTGGGAIQTVTSVDATKAYFATGGTDWFNFNQRNAADGTVMELCPAGNPIPGAACVGGFGAMKLYRLLMLTYYVDTTGPEPRLTRVQNHFTPQALAGVVEDLELTYDVVDSVTNPTGLPSLPVTLNGLTYTANQIRKVNLHIGVRSDLLSPGQVDYIRNHMTTSVSIRNLASINRYQ